MKKNSQALLLAILWFVMVTILLIIPGTKLPAIKWLGVLEMDKIIHFILFFILCLLFCRTAYSFNKTQNWFWLIAFACSVFGLTMEFVQENFVINRAFDIWDIVADFIGSFTFLVYLNLKPQFLSK